MRRAAVERRLRALEQQQITGREQVIWIQPSDMQTGAVVGVAVEVRPVLRGPIDYRECIAALVPPECAAQEKKGHRT